MSSVSPILVSVSSSICLRMNAGSTNRSSVGAGMRSRASAARLVPPARIGWTVTTASAGGPSRVSIVSMALPSRSDRIASSSPATAAAASACRAACEFSCGPWLPSACAPAGELDELRTEQILRLARQDLSRVPVVLHDAPVVVDPEDQGPNGRGHGRMRTLGGDASSRGLRGFGDPGLLDVRAGLDPRLRLVPLPGARGNGARLAVTPPSEAPAPRALPFADMPDVTCGLLMASQAVLLSIMSHGRHVQTGVPMTHLSPEKSHFYTFLT